jgi:hypothetical protein
MHKQNSKPIFKTLLFYAIITICSLNFNGSVFAQGWIWTDYNGADYTLEGAVYANGLYVAVGGYGTVYTSDDAETWNAINPVTDEHLKSIVYYNGTYIAVGCNGMIISSQNGTDWTIISTTISGDLFSITHHSDRLVAVGAYWDAEADMLKGLVAISDDDGATWTGIPLPTLGALKGITYGDGFYIAVGYEDPPIGQVLPIIATSQDGLDWNRQVTDPSLDGAILEEVLYAGGKYIITGEISNLILLSQDASTWEQIPVGGAVAKWRGIAYAEEAGGLFVIAGTSIFSSPDGLVWTFRRDTMSENAISYGMTYGNKNIVAVGWGGWNASQVAFAPEIMAAMVVPDDIDGDGISNDLENTMCTDPYDADTDDDGLHDGAEDANKDGVIDVDETDPCDADTDGDGIQDGTELGITLGHPTDTGPGFIPDADGGATKTDPLDDDTDNDGLLDGEEDININGVVDPGESDPNIPDPGSPPPIANMTGIYLLLLDD